MGSTVSDIKEDLNGVNSKLNRMLSLMRVFLNKIKKLESKVEEQDKIITNHKREIQHLTNRCDNNERLARSNKIILASPVINTQTNNFYDAVKLILRDGFELPPGIIAMIMINRFGCAKVTVLLDLPSAAIKANIFSAKKSLRDKPEYANLFVNEFLSRKNGELLKKARALKKEEKLVSAFTYNGQVYIKKEENGDKILVSDMTDLQIDE